MKEDPQKLDKQQLNIDPAPVDEQQNWTLEEIMDEFGGWSKKAPVADEPVQLLPPEEVTVDTPEPDVKIAPENPGKPILRIVPSPEQETDEDAKAEPPPAGEQPSAVSADTIRFAPVTEPQAGQEEKPAVWTYKGEPAPEAEEKTAEKKKADRQREQQAARARRRELRLRRQQQRLSRRQEAKREVPEHTFASAKEAWQFYSKESSLQTRLVLSVLLCLLSAAMLVLCSLRIGTVDFTAQSALLSKLMVGVFLLTALLNYDILAAGLVNALQLHFDQKSLLLLVCAVTAVDAFAALAEGRVPLCTVAGLELTAAIWSSVLLRRARRRTLKAVCAMESPTASVREEKAWHGYDCIFRSEGDADAFVTQLELPDAGSRVMRIYAPICAALTLGLSILASIRASKDFLWTWSALLLAGCPAGFLIAFSRSFAVQSKRLIRAGCAVAGWYGAKTLGGECGMVVTDSDLFPAENVTLSGMKIYSERPIGHIVGYASAVVETAGSGLTGVFDEMMREQNGRRFTVDTFRRYEGGGLGAEISGDVVLMGSLAFMKLMKVRMPEGTRLKQAVYLSINSELAAVFALSYAADEAAKESLQSAVRVKGLMPILATRDFMITPQLLKHRYKIPPERIEFPTVEERARLSDDGVIRDGKQGALMVRPGVACFTKAVIGARAIRSASIGAMVISLLGSLLGILLVFFLALIGAIQAVSCWNLFVFSLLWLLPVLLIAGLSGRSV